MTRVPLRIRLEKRARALTGKFTIVGFFSVKNLFFENLLKWKMGYAGSLVIEYFLISPLNCTSNENRGAVRVPYK